MLRLLFILLAFPSTSRELSNNPQIEDCAKIAQLDEMKECYALAANLTYNPNEIYSGIGSHKQLKCKLGQNALATQPGDDFVWLKDGVMLKTSGACFTASNRKWPAQIECTNYNFHTSDGIYFCVNEVTNQLFNLKIIHLQGQLNSNPGLCE